MKKPLEFQRREWCGLIHTTTQRNRHETSLFGGVNLLLRNAWETTTFTITGSAVYIGVRNFAFKQNGKILGVIQDANRGYIKSNNIPPHSLK